MGQTEEAKDIRNFLAMPVSYEGTAHPRLCSHASVLSWGRR